VLCNGMILSLGVLRPPVIESQNLIGPLSFSLPMLCSQVDYSRELVENALERHANSCLAELRPPGLLPFVWMVLTMASSNMTMHMIRGALVNVFVCFNPIFGVFLLPRVWQRFAATDLGCSRGEL
jgi:hypothetical protein